MTWAGCGWRAIFVAVMLIAGAGQVLAESRPPSGVFLRIETGMHVDKINQVGLDSTCRMMITGSDDKTARLWAVPEGGKGTFSPRGILRVPVGPENNGGIKAATLSPDGKYAALGAEYIPDGGTDESAVYIFETATGKPVRRIAGLDAAIYQLVYSPGGEYLAAALSSGRGMRVWETSGWRQVGSDDGYGESAYSVSFAPDGKVFTLAYDGMLRRYGSNFKLEAKVQTGHRNAADVVVHPRGDKLAIAVADTPKVEIYDTRSLTRMYEADMSRVTNRSLFAVTWSTDGSRLYGAGDFSTPDRRVPVRIWDNEGRGKGRDVKVTLTTIHDLVPCRKWIAIGSSDPAFGIMSESGEVLSWRTSVKPDLRNKLGQAFTVSADGSKVTFGMKSGHDEMVTFDMASWSITNASTRTAGMFPADVSSLNITGWLNTTTPRVNGKVLQLLDREYSTAVAIAPGSQSLALGTEWHVRYFEKDGRERWTRDTPANWGVNVTRDGKFVVAAFGDGTIRWFRAGDGEEIMALFVHTQTREWVAWTPQGYYASSAGGDRYIGWAVNRGWNESPVFHTAAELKRHLYRPDVVRAAFDLGDAADAVRQAGVSNFKLDDLNKHRPPQFEITSPTDNSRTSSSPLPVSLQLLDDADPLTGIDVTVNGRQISAQEKQGSGGKTQALTVPLEQGENRIRVTARNAVGETARDVTVFLSSAGTLNKKGKLYILSVGVDTYAKLGAQNGLKYASADARLIMETLMSKSGPLHTDVKHSLLVSGATTPPTKANIEDALAMFREAGPEDTTVVFLAGHGVNEGADYLFMPEDSEFKDGRWRPSSVLKWHVLQLALQGAQGRRILFVDTCHSGGAYNPRLIKDAVDANIVVFSATDSATLAQEQEALGHGVFTYALAKGLKGEADFQKKGTVNILGLADFVSTEVKRLTRDAQEPTFNLSGSANFVMALP